MLRPLKLVPFGSVPIFHYFPFSYFTAPAESGAGDEIALRDFEETFCAHIVIELSKSRVQNWVAQWLRNWQEYFEFGKGLALQERWEESWDDEDAWCEWLHCCSSDPFAELPDQWELE